MEDEIYEWFKTKNFKPVTLKELIRVFNINEKNMDNFIDMLFELEKKGKIIGNNIDHSYQLMPEEYIYVPGKVELSNSGNLFSNYKNGSKIIIRNKFDSKKNSHVKKDDYVLINPTKSEKNKRLYNGEVVHIVKKMNINPNGFFYRSTIMKDNSYSLNYILYNGQKYYIDNDKLNGAYTGDDVSIYLSFVDNKYVAKVVNIIKRKSNCHLYYVDNDLNVFTYNTTIKKVNLEDLPHNITRETLIVAEEKNGKLYFVKEINHNNELENDIEMMAYEHGIPFEFSADCLNEADKLNGNISDSEIKTRLDLRDLVTFTIDGKKAKDFDDAVSVIRNDNGYRLFVSIADVSYYVKPDSEIFLEALNRGTSIYPPGFVIPMLPEKLSNDICSLNPHEDKLTKTCVIDISSDGKVLDYFVENSIINSNMRMNYSDVNTILNCHGLPKDYKLYVDNLFLMQELAEILETRRQKRGYINLENEEIDFDFSDDGNIQDIYNRKRDKAEILIENFMLLANEATTSFVYNMAQAYIYRNHEAPNIDRLEKIKKNLQKKNYKLVSFRNANNPRIFQSQIKKILKGKSDSEKKEINKIVLQGLNRAEYSSINIGHFGLALNIYGTFTSPIRKISDLLNHIVIGYIIDGNIDGLKWCKENYDNFAKLATIKQIEADKFEQEIDALAVRKYLIKHIDNVYNGLVTLVNRDHIFIKIKGTITGIIPRKGNEHLSTGDIINVKVIGVDDKKNIIYFDNSFEKGIDENDKHKRK